MQSGNSFGLSTFDYIIMYVTNPASLLIIAGGTFLCLSHFGALKLPKWAAVISWIAVVLGALYWLVFGFFIMMFASENKRFDSVRYDFPLAVESFEI